MPNKKLPYGKCDFADIIERNFAYVDKTRYVEMLENENNGYQFMLRPRRFGKSLFLSVLENYYDINRKDRFDALFGGLYIGKHPTPERGRYAVLKFDFSRVDTENHDRFTTAFLSVVQESVCLFFERYKNLFPNADEEIRRISDQNMGINSLLPACRAATLANVPIFAIVDEYDNFASGLAAMGETYDGEIVRDGAVRTFYKSLKSATSNSTVRRMFITGVSPMMVNDMTSGFNMATDLSLLPKYNEMFGFTREEIERLMDETGVDRKHITIDMEYYYNGYMFNYEGKNKVYNSQMVLFLFDQILQLGKPPQEIVDPNLKTGYDKLEFFARNPDNRDKLLDIVRDGGIHSSITRSISLKELRSGSVFVSMLYYMGMLTHDETSENWTFLKIPNYSINTLYWEYVVAYLNDLGGKSIDTSKIEATFRDMAFKGEIKPYLDFFVENFLKRLSNRDLANFNEKFIKVMLLSSLVLCEFYRAVSEDENINGYTDIYLPRNPARPGIKYEYVFELKYVKTKAAKNEVNAKFEEAFAQIEKYKQDPRFAGRDDVRFAAIVFSGKGDYEAREA